MRSLILYILFAMILSSDVAAQDSHIIKTIDPIEPQAIDINKESLVFAVPDSLMNYYLSGSVFCLIIVDVNLKIVDLIIEGVNIVSKGENIVYSSPIEKDTESLNEYKIQGFPNVDYPANVEFLYQYIWEEKDNIKISPSKAIEYEFPIIWTVPIKFAVISTE